MRTINTDLTRFSSSGHGTVYGAAVRDLQAGEHIAVTDEDANTLEAEVLRVSEGRADIRIFWGNVMGGA